MSWNQGYHCLPLDKLANTNEELSKLEGELSTKDAQIAFAKFCQANPSFTAKILMGIDLYEFQDIFIRAMTLKDFFLGICGRGLGKCQSYFDSFVITEKNGLIPLPDLIPNIEFKDEEYILEIPKTKLWNGCHFENVDRVLVQKGLRGLKVSSRMGFSLTGSVRHRVRVLDENGRIVWKRYDEINSETDYLCISRNETPGCEGGPLENVESYIVGLILGDGTISPNAGKYYIGISSADEDLLSYIEPFCGQRVADKRSKAICLNFKSNFSKKLIEKYGLQRSLSYEKQIPPFILSNKTLLKYCLRGLFDTDGGFEGDGSTVSFCTVSEKMAQQVHLSLLNFGIVSHFSEKQTRSTFGKAFIIRMHGRDAKLFYERIGFGLQRKQKGKQVFENNVLNSNIDVIPNVKHLIKRIINESEFTYREVGERYWVSKNNRKNIGRNTLCGFIDRMEELGHQSQNLENLKRLANGEYFFDKVTSIENVIVDCIDFCDIPNESCYWSNGFINHNTTIAGIFVPIYAIFNPGVRIGITSITFRQARNIMESIETFIESKDGQYLKQCVVGKPSHRNDAWEIKFGMPGGKVSKVVAIPLGIGDKIRGYRFNVLIIDEMLLISERIINEVLQPFMAIQADPRERQKLRDAEERLIGAGKLKEEDRTVFANNKLIGLTSATYEFEFLYELYEHYLDVIFDKNAKNVNHAIFQMSYLCGPKGLYQEGVIENAKKTYSKAQFDREYMAKFTGDSSGFFSARKMQEVSLDVGDKPHILVSGNPGKRYILAIDPNYDDAETADHFAMCLLEIDYENESGTLVHAYALSKSDLNARGLYIKYLFDHFDIVYVIVDNAGGSKFIKDMNSLGVLDFKLEFFAADFDKDDPKKIEEAKATYQPAGGTVRAIVHSQVFSGHWNRLSNEALQANIDLKKIWFAAPADPDSVAKPSTIPIKELHFNDENYKDTRSALEMKMYDFVEHQRYMISLTKSEMSLIEATTNASGTMRFDLPSEVAKSEGANRTRKDSYTVMVLANWGLECYFLLLRTHAKKIQRVKPRFLA